jgi:cytochrome P450
VPSIKRIIPVSDVQPGDSFASADGSIRFVTKVHLYQDWIPEIWLYSLASDGSVHTDRRGVKSVVTVGFTNRKAKRLRGKMARRARLGASRDGASPP